MLQQTQISTVGGVSTSDLKNLVMTSPHDVIVTSQIDKIRGVTTKSHRVTPSFDLWWADPGGTAKAREVQKACNACDPGGSAKPRKAESIYRLRRKTGRRRWFLPSSRLRQMHRSRCELTFFRSRVERT